MSPSLVQNDSPINWSLATRLAAWAGIAFAALLMVVVAATSDRGSQRLAGLFAPASSPTGPTTTGPQLAGRPFDPEVEARRQSEAIKLLAADRDRLLARLAALERNLDGVTGSITPRPPDDRPAASPVPPDLATAPRPSAPLVLPPVDLPTGPAPAPRPATTQPAAPPSGQPAPATNRVTGAHQAIATNPAATASTATKTEFGIDLGSAATFEALRAQWAALKGTHPALLEGLRPLVAVRDGQKPGAIELRLVAGPLANAGAAAQLCAGLAAAGRGCQPTVFDGQRLALQ